MAVIVALFTSSPAAIAQETSELRTSEFSQALTSLTRLHKLSPEMQQFFEQKGRISPAAIEPLRKSFAQAGLDPIGYCCHNNGKCDCTGMLDCATMLVLNTCNDDEPIVCDSDGCVCTEAGPTLCPFDDCCYD